MLPVLVGRNPWLLVEVLLIVGVVRAVCLDRDDGRGMGWFLRIAAVLVTVGVAFNVLTVHSGDRVIGTLPREWPVVGGEVTLNALAYGILGGVALFSLILVGITMTAMISWLDLFHLLPERLAAIAVTGSVAWSFLPRLADAWATIREAQVMRGQRLDRPRDLLPLVTPLLASSLDRALVTAEVLEARGFGGSLAGLGCRRTRWQAVGAVTIVAALVPAAVGAFCLAVARPGWGMASIALALLMVATGTRLDPRPGPNRTRLVEPVWTTADTIVTVAAAIAILSVVGLAIADPAALAYSTYPTLELPQVPLGVMIGQAFLLAPALVAARPVTP